MIEGFRIRTEIDSRKCGQAVDGRVPVRGRGNVAVGHLEPYLLALVPDTVRAAAVAGNNMFDSLDRDTRSEHRLEQIEFGRTEPLACGCRCTDRTMILHQEEPAAPLAFHLRHVTFLGANMGQSLHLLLERQRSRNARRIFFLLPRAS